MGYGLKMGNKHPKDKKIPFIRKVCGHKSDTEIQEAERSFRRFINVLIEIQSNKENDRNQLEDTSIKWFN